MSVLGDIVTEAARRFGDARALVAPDGWGVSFRDLDRSSDEAAAGMVARGVRAGDVVASLLPSSPAYVIAYAAAAKIGAATAGINPRLAPAERARLLAIAAPSLILADPDLAVPFDAPTLVTSSRDLRELRVPDAEPARAAPDPDRPVAIVFTSGTTGIPRGAVFTDRQLDAVRAMDAGDAWGGGEPMLASTEMAHIGFMTKLPWYLRRGARIHMLGRWRAEAALRLIAEQRLSTVGGIAAQIALMLRVEGFDSYDLSSVRAIVAGGGPSSPALIREARARFGAPYSVRYSSTESGGLGTLTALDADDDEALYTVGRPRAGIDLAIRDGDEDLPVGETGTVCLRSPAIMSGYHRDPEATGRVLRDGWLITGDRGFVDERGRLHLTGRASDMFIRGGYNVHPQAVEQVLEDHPAVARIAVVARPDPVMGEIGVAVVVPADAACPPTLDDLRAFGGARLAAYELPEAIRIADDLPLNAMHKLDRRALAARERTETE